GGREVAGVGLARHVGVAGAVHGDALAPIKAAAAEVGGVGQGRAAGVQLGHEGVVDAAVGRLERAGGREVAGVGKARHVGVAGGVHGDAIGPLTAAAAQVGGVAQDRVDGQRLGGVVGADREPDL